MDHQMTRVAVALCDAVGTPVAVEVKALIKAGEWAQLQKLRVRPSDYNDSESYFRDNLVVELLRKCKLDSGVDTEQRARDTFWECETQNAHTNVRLSRFLPENLCLDADDPDWNVVGFIDRWRKEIKRVVGVLPDSLTPRFSQGATFADTGKLITIPDKMSSVPTLYASSSWVQDLWSHTSWCRALVAQGRGGVNTVRGNIFFTVIKDGTTDRGCCKEASLNVSYQLDAGRVLRTRLRRVSIDLLTGQALHNELARQASIDGKSATLDMSNASDTLCRVLPRLVMPHQWWELLNSLRASHTRIEKKWVRLEKFSSMGNGFTFELETLIFATLARVCCSDLGLDPGRVSCYGDDLIVPTEAARYVIAALKLFGFTPNMKKTFVEGPFRESCGGDYWSGVPVSGIHLKELPDEPQKWIALANAFRRVVDGDLARGCDGVSRHSLAWLPWLRCLDAIPSAIRDCRGPAFLGDVVIHDSPERWQVRDIGRQRGHAVRQVRSYSPIPVILHWHHWKPDVQLASCTLGLESRGITPRGGIAGYRFRWVTSNLTNHWLPEPK